MFTLERHWRQSKLPVYRLLYVDQCRKVGTMCGEAHRTHYQSLISSLKMHQTKRSFATTNNKLTMRNATQVLLKAHHNIEELCEWFVKFFGDKIQKIRSSLIEVRGYHYTSTRAWVWAYLERILWGNSRRVKKDITH